MAHRIYLYNIDSQTKQVFEGYLAEWNYVIPDLLLPLVSAKAQTKGHSLYFDKEEGLHRLSCFYDLLTETYQLHDMVPFSSAVEQMFEFLYALPYDTFYMDASDVYAMQEEKPKEQAKAWILEINEKWALYQQAIDQEDLAVLDSLIQASGYTSFLDALEHDWVQYGLGYWEEHLVKQTCTIVFTAGNYQGLKDKKGHILTAAVYDTIYAFTDAGVAVVEKEGKFGYLNTQGKLLIPLQYEDAFDAYLINQTVVAQVCLAGKTGLLHLHTQKEVLAVVYDEVERLYGQYYNVLQNGQYQLLDYTGKQIVGERSDFPFELEYPLTFFTKQKESAKRRFFTLTGQFLGAYPEGVLEELPLGYFWVKPNKYQTKIHILNPKGTIICEGIDQIMVFSGYTSFAYKSEKKWKLFDCQTDRSLLTDWVIDKINANYLCSYMPDTYVIQTAEGCGVYHAATNQWLIALDQNHVKIEHLKQRLLLVIQKQGMYYYNEETATLSERYAYISQPIDEYTQEACLFQDTQLYYLDQNAKRQEVSPEKLGQLYEKRYNLRGNDLAYFTSFYEAWTTRMGDQYETYFDGDTLYQRGCVARDEADWPLAIKYFSIGAERGEARMQYELGLLLTDQHAWTNVEQGVYYLEQAAQQDYANAWNTLGYLYQNSLGYPYDREAMLAAYKKAVELGCVWANMNLGDLYFYGQEVEQDYDKAVSHYILAEHYYGAYAQNLVEIHYQRRDFEQVLRYLKRNSGEPYVHIYYGILYDHGYGIKSSEKMAIEHYEAAITHQGYAYAVERLCYYYKEHPKYKDEVAYARIVVYATENDIEIEN
ncbi:SEL1-like repeat protein [Myroides sp. C15-4]|uniref:SEL1-like repeat protein n=1 Tax=Myroides sp. C15-4 TaxID=3400532 RepID=UPI003D2F9837